MRSVASIAAISDTRETEIDHGEQNELLVEDRIDSEACCGCY